MKLCLDTNIISAFFFKRNNKVAERFRNAVKNGNEISLTVFITFFFLNFFQLLPR